MSLKFLPYADFQKIVCPLFWVISFLLWESISHLLMFEAFQVKFLYAVCLDICIALIISSIVQLLPAKLQGWLNAALSFLITVIYCSQMIYCAIFGTPYSVSVMGQGGQAIRNFFGETLSTMGDIWYYLMAMFVPFGCSLYLAVKKILRKNSRRIIAFELFLACAAAVLFSFCLGKGGKGRFSDYYFFINQKSTTSQSMERFGVLPTFSLELMRPEPDSTDSLSAPVIYAPAVNEMAHDGLPDDELIEDLPASEAVYNILPLDIDPANSDTTNYRYQNLNQYFMQLPGTKQNAYTGMLRDYNLIMLCCESYSPAAVDPVLTPTLYRMREESIHFNNYYNSYPNITTDGEYAFLQGLFPDDSKAKFSASMAASANNSLPFTVANAFSEQLGIECLGFHGNTGGFYERSSTHPNMGYKMAFSNGGLSLEEGISPASDLEVMEKSVDRYIGQKQFHAYYMTYSGHFKYDTETNMMAKKNWNLVKDLPNLNKAQKAYLACHIELDKALAYLLKRLDDAGILEKTVIVMAADHFPYGLTDKEYSELLGSPIDDFSKYKSDLIIWVGGQKTPISTDAYCCNVDILPTILNLWGLEYDSRMLSGTDIFSDGPHVAVLRNRSFLTDIAWFNSNTLEVIPQTESGEIPENYVDDMCTMLDQKFTAAADVLNSNYYQYVIAHKRSEATELTDAAASE